MIRVAVLFGLGFAAFVASAVVGHFALQGLRRLEGHGAIRDAAPSVEDSNGWSVASFLWRVRVPLSSKEARRMVDLYRGLQVLAVGLMIWGLASA